MNTKILSWLSPASAWRFLPAAAALLCATCAPVHTTTPKPEDGDEPAATVPAETLPKPPEPVRDPLKHRLELAIDNVRERDLLTTNGFWTIFHGILGLGPSVTLLDPATGKRVNAVDYICDGGELRGLRFNPTRWGLDVQLGPFMVGQGHQDQFVAEMGQWGMTPDRTFNVLGKDYTFMDFVRHSQMRARINQKQELSWTILVVGQYLGTDVCWTNAHGERLRYEDLLRYELDLPIEEAPCGGTHRLFDLAWVYQLHELRGGDMSGIWQEIPTKIATYRNLARKYQNPDGSFSTNFFRGPGNAADSQLRINTSGHILEFLALALSDEELKQQWVQEAANAVALMILEQKGSPIEGGSLYHATHGLILYYDRVYGGDFLGPNKPIRPNVGLGAQRLGLPHPVEEKPSKEP
jgi:hypothetical protein